VGQISRNDTTRGIRVMMVDVGDTALKSGCRVPAIQGFSGWNKMGIGKMDNLHR
jgi:hypothetical protein